MNPRRQWPAAVRLHTEHEPELVRLLLGLDRASRVARFACATSDAALLQHSQHALASAVWVGGIVVERQLRGLVELYDSGDNGVVEAAFLVESGWRRRGVGTALMCAAKAWVADNGRSAVRMIFLASNWPMRRLASGAGARIDIAFGEMIADLSVEPAREVGSKRQGPAHDMVL